MTRFARLLIAAARYCFSVPLRAQATLTSFRAGSLLISTRMRGNLTIWSTRMSTRSRLWLVTASAVCLGSPALAQDTLKIGELNSYKAQPAFLEPYKKGWEFAVEEINAKSGVLGKKLEVASRDDGASPGDAVRVANELVTREGTNIIACTFLSNIGLAVTEFAGKEKVFFLAAEPLTDKITWQNGNKYTFRLRPSTYMQVAMLMP